jgi:hypothetical protein
VTAKRAEAVAPASGREPSRSSALSGRDANAFSSNQVMHQRIGLPRHDAGGIGGGIGGGLARGCRASTKTAGLECILAESSLNPAFCLLSKLACGLARQGDGQDRLAWRVRREEDSRAEAEAATGPPPPRRPRGLQRADASAIPAGAATRTLACRTPTTTWLPCDLQHASRRTRWSNPCSAASLREHRALAPVWYRTVHPWALRLAPRKEDARCTRGATRSSSIRVHDHKAKVCQILPDPPCCGGL